MKKVIRIGTRDSQLALWQAHTVQNKLDAFGYKTELVAVKSTGDLQLEKPLYELGITGVFTKTLDVAMLNGTVDIAVHSMKDVPTLLPQGIVQTAVLQQKVLLSITLWKLQILQLLLLIALYVRAATFSYQLLSLFLAHLFIFGTTGKDRLLEIVRF